MIKNKKALSSRYPQARILLDLAEEALFYLQPENLIRQHVRLKNNRLIIDKKVFDLHKIENIYVLGAGKATYQMALVIDKILNKKITAGAINVPKAYTKKIGRINVTQASHPFPNEAGVAGAQAILDLANRAGNKDLVICLMSGGGSALMPLPPYNFSLQEKIELTRKLLKCSANIKEINCVRKHLSQIKGGRLGAAAMPATIVSLYISDVIGDDLNAIASGPTVPDPSTSKQAIKILKKYKISDKKLELIILENESPKFLDKKKVFNFIVGNNQQVLDHLILLAKRKKYKTKFLTATLHGEAKAVAKRLIALAEKLNRKTILIAGGETTVKIIGKGFGGRNQEFVLAASQYIGQDLTVLSLATDGVDGLTPKPVAGAILDSKNAPKNANKYLENNDSYTILNKIHSLLKTGLTGTNVGDIILLLKN
ncbi:MAG: DUF4147 domain-containing protein [Patescibacteria group bacterium]|jgi:hydroxypyruvate reductase